MRGLHLESNLGSPIEKVYAVPVVAISAKPGADPEQTLDKAGLLVI